MSVQEIKAELAALPRKDQDEILAFLFHVRHAHDADYQATISRRMGDKDPAHWLTPDEFESELDKREAR
jgi:hypothetical protein